MADSGCRMHSLAIWMTGRQEFTRDKASVKLKRLSCFCPRKHVKALQWQVAILYICIVKQVHVACAHSTNICCIACLCVYSYTVLSFVEIVKELLSDCNLQQCYILSGKFNQDPLENFFGKVRQSGGWSGSPSAKIVEEPPIRSGCKHHQWWVKCRKHPQ